MSSKYYLGVIPGVALYIGMTTISNNALYV